VSCASSRRRFRPSVECLECRTVPTGVQPTPAEQLFLEQVNDLRADPRAYGLAIGLDLSHVAPAPPLALNSLLTRAARSHAEAMADQDFVSHVSPVGGRTGQRIGATGYSWESVVESLAAGDGYPDSASALEALIEDRGVEDLGHRRHLLAIDGAFTRQREIGVGVVQGRGRHTNYYVLDTADGHDPRPFLTGVVYHDDNANGRYDAGEGLPGVTVHAAGAGETRTFDTGGWSLPVHPGTHTVRIAGSGVPGGTSRTVTVGGANVRVNFSLRHDDPQADGFVRQLYRVALGRDAGPEEVALWRGAVQVHGAPAVAEAVARSHEARTRLVRAWYVTHLGRVPLGGEEQGWVQGLLAGAEEERVRAGILGSDEFYRRVGGRNEALVQTLFGVLLGRAASPAEVVAYRDHVVPAAGRAGAALIVLLSQEHRTAEVRQFYSDLLGRTREPAPEEVHGWAGSELDVMRIRLGFLASAEFLDRAG
jgi:uncharacterized protein YkwD